MRIALGLFSALAKVQFQSGAASPIFLKVNKHLIILLQCKKPPKTTKNTTLADFKSLHHSFPQSHPPLSSFFLSVNMSGEEHKKGRVSELEGQQRASGRAMFLLSGPQREGAKEGEREGGRECERRGGEVGMEQPFFFISLGTARESVRAECFGHPDPGLSTSFTEEAFSLECWLPLPCHPRQEGKQGRRVVCTPC